MLGDQLFFSACFWFSPSYKLTLVSAQLLAAAHFPALWVTGSCSSAESRCRNG